MKRLLPRLVVGFLTLAIGVYTHLEARRIADYFWPDSMIEAVPISVEFVDPIIEKSCDRITAAWHQGRLSCPIPSHVQMRCWGVDEGKAHPLAQIIAHSLGH